MDKVFIGIDPGMNGGLASVEVDDDVITDIQVMKMPTIGKELDLHAIDTFLTRRLEYREVVVIIEKVTSMPKQGVTSMFNFGFWTGTIHGIISVHFIPKHVITPQAWKKVVLAGTNKDKDAAIAYCTNTYPNVKLIPDRCRKPSDGIADALCIASYGWLKRL